MHETWSYSWLTTSIICWYDCVVVSGSSPSLASCGSRSVKFCTPAPGAKSAIYNCLVWWCDCVVVVSGSTVRLGLRRHAAVDRRSSALRARNSAQHRAVTLHSVLPARGSDGSRRAGDPRTWSRPHGHEVQNSRVRRHHCAGTLISVFCTGYCLITAWGKLYSSCV